MNFAVTETERLRLEPIAMHHVDDVAAMLADPRVAETMGGVRDRAFTEERTSIHASQWREHGFGLWAAYSLTDGGFVGRGGIQHTTLAGADVVEAGWCVVPSRWRQGFAREMAEAGLVLGFGELALPEIVAFTLPHNVASRALMDRLGMTYLRDCLHAGMPHVVYSIRGTG
jgi:RimJ/RimL family protein N-acetyltransferase